MKNFSFIFFVGVFLNSCINTNKPEIQASYIQGYNSFPKAMVNHIPNKLPNNRITFSVSFPASLTEYNLYAGIYLLTKISSRDKYLKLKKKLSSKVEYTGSSTDNNFIIVRTGGELLNSKTVDRSSINSYPIPQYAIYTKNKNNDKWKIQENSDVAILDCKSIHTFKGVKLKPKKDMPNEWKDGYSKGYTFNDSTKTIKYWLIIW